MRAPGFWRGGDGGGLLPLLLSPVAAVYGAATARRMRRPGWRAPVPVICCGNATAGGSGKTTVALDIGRRLANRGIAVHFLLRGYGGTLRGPLRVEGNDPAAALAALAEGVLSDADRARGMAEAAAATAAAAEGLPGQMADALLRLLPPPSVGRGAAATGAEAAF